jgi:hypothetical protein
MGMLSYDSTLAPLSGRANRPRKPGQSEGLG